MIRIMHVSKSFGEYKVLKNINIDIEDGKIYGLIGKNGSGKTVLLKCLCGFMKLTEGEINVDGQIVGKDIDMLPNTGVIIETPGFIGNYNGYKNLKILAKINNKVDDNRINEVLELVGLNNVGRKKVSKYSLGMRQRLAIAQAIMENPKILVLDEPTNGLDDTGVEEVRNILLNLKSKGTTIIMASHNKEDIEVLCDEVFFIKNGELQ